MVVAGVVSVAVAIAAFFVGVLLVLVAAIVFTIAFVAALAITVGLLIVAFSVAAVVFVGPIILFVGAVVFLVSGVLALGHRRPRPRRVRRQRWVGHRMPIRARRPTARVIQPRPDRVLVPGRIHRVNRVSRILPGPRQGRAGVDQLELEGATRPELEHV